MTAPEYAPLSPDAADRSIRGWLGHAGPVLAVAVTPIAEQAFPHSSTHATQSAIAVAASVALFVTWLATWRFARTHRHTLDPWFAYAYLPVIALWREAAGGANSGYGPLVLGPLVFLALHARRHHVLVCAAGIAALFVAPIHLLDPDAYPLLQEGRRATIWTLTALVSGLTVHRIVRLAAQANRTTELVLERIPGTTVVIFDRGLRHLSVHGVGSGTDDGIEWSTLVGMTPAQLFGPRAGRFEQELLLTIEGTPRQFEWRSTSGKRTHLVTTSPWIPTGPDDPAAGLMVVRDITERVRLEGEVERDHAFLRAVLDNMQDGVVAIDSRGTSQFVNDSFRDMLGIDATTDPNQDDGLASTYLLMDGDGRELSREATPLRRAFRGEYVPREPLSVRLPDGTLRDLEATAAPIVVYGDAILGAVMSLHDVSARREAERMKEQFFALVSHELRTPLAAIVGYLELLDEEEHDNLSADGREFVAVMQRNSQRLMRLIGDLLFAAQVESGNLTLVKGPMNLVDVARHAHDTARVRAAVRNQSITLDAGDTPAELPYVGDRDRLGQVLDNLLTNAIKFTPDGGAIEVRVRADTDAVRLEVADTGRGIAEEDRLRLFERFARAQSADDEAVQGVGLGLAITKAIVDAHGGTIELDSEVGVGTTFRIVLPRTDSMAPEHAYEQHVRA